MGTSQRGIASWYGDPFHGRATASGEIYDMHGMTAAHKELPLGTVVDVTNLENGRSVRVRVNDRGPFVRGRVIDLSYAAASELRMVGPGTVKVEIVVIALGNGPSGPNMATRYTVQVGAFRDPENARRVRAALVGEYPEAELVVTGKWHRVRLGTFRSQRDAEKIRRTLRRQGYDAIVIALN
ncbi:MAG: septal ring lytic transglycosylase RlpA family protein [Holophagales bacterium]|nr:septal ring lytic transglycosylase RlpA family protein [Holophagales bacterium]